MLNIYSCYAYVWFTVLILYLLGLSGFNSPLSVSLLMFLLASCLVSLFLGYISHISNQKMESSEDMPEQSRSYLAPIVFTIFFFLDFAYQGGVPLFTGSYSGYDVGAETQETVGIPVVHVLIAALAIFYTVYLSAFIAKSVSFNLLVKYSWMISLLILNQSRGYVTYCIIILVFLILMNHPLSVKVNSVLVFLLAFIMLLVLVFFIGAFGNVRSGKNWNDNSFIEAIGNYTIWPPLIPKQFMWTYTYVTTPLANLNLSLNSSSGIKSTLDLFLSMLPENLIKSNMSSFVISRDFIATYLNASTGFSLPVEIAGQVGLYYYFLFQVIYFAIFDAFFRKQRCFIRLSRAIMCFFSVLGLFMSPFSVISSCYLLPILAVRAYCFRKDISIKTILSSSREVLFNGN